MAFTVTKTEVYNFDYTKEITEIEDELKFVNQRLKAAKDYLKALKDIGPDINKLQAQALRNQFEEDKNKY